MINHVSPMTNSNAYASVQSSNDVPYYITKPLNETQKQTQKQDEEKVSKKKKTSWYKVAVTALVAGVGILFFSKGLTKGMKGNFNKWFRELFDKQTKLGKKKNLSGFDKFRDRLVDIGQKIIIKSKILFNAAPLKDALLMKYIKKSPKLKEYSDKISNYFEKISVKTSKRVYNKTTSRFEEMYAAFDEIGAKLSKNDKEELNRRVQKIQSDYRDGFGEVARNRRMKEIKENMKGIDDDVYNQTWGDLKYFWEKQKSVQPFISEAVAVEKKANNLQNIEYFRSAITNNIEDDYKATRKLLDKLDYVIDTTDPRSRVYVKNVGKVLDKYRSETKAGRNANNLLFNGEISKNLRQLDEYMAASNKYDKDITKAFSKNINNLCKVLDDNKRGEVQQILAMLKKTLSEKDYQKVRKIAYKATNSLNRAVDTEGDKLFDKIRDLIIGSAPMDVLGLVSSLGVVVWGLMHAENNDERISATLKYGIPAVGGVATTLYCTLGLISAGPSLIIGLISGALINKLGIEADHLRKKYMGKQVDANEETIAKISAEKLKQKTQQIEGKVKNERSNSK